jgi:hypothetical protein
VVSGEGGGVGCVSRDRTTLSRLRSRVLDVSYFWEGRKREGSEGVEGAKWDAQCVIVE